MEITSRYPSHRIRYGFLEDLAKFTLIGRERLNAVRAEIRAIEKVGLAKEVHEQKLAEAQEIAEAVLDAETKLGELTSKLKTMQGQRKDLQHIPNSGEKSKKEQLKDLGITHEERFETLANHPEVVEQAKADARAEGRIVTRSDVLNRIAPPKTHKQTMNDIKRQAQKEHEEFKNSTVVNLEDAKQDKENIELLALDVSITINKALAGVTGLGMLKESEIELMKKNLKPLAKQDMISSCYAATRTITHILKIIGG